MGGGVDCSLNPSTHYPQLRYIGEGATPAIIRERPVLGPVGDAIIKAIGTNGADAHSTATDIKMGLLNHHRRRS